MKVKIMKYLMRCVSITLFCFSMLGFQSSSSHASRSDRSTPSCDFVQSFCINGFLAGTNICRSLSVECTDEQTGVSDFRRRVEARERLFEEVTEEYANPPWDPYDTALSRWTRDLLRRIYGRG